MQQTAVTHASDPLNIIKTRSESTCGELHLHCTTTPAYLCYTTATALKPDGNTPREDLEEKVSLTHKTEKERWCVLEPRIQRVVPLGRAVPVRVALFAAFCSQTGTSSGFCVWLLTRGVSRVLHHRFRKARADQPTLASVCLQCSHRVVKTPRGRSRTQTHTQPCS